MRGDLTFNQRLADRTSLDRNIRMLIRKTSLEPVGFSALHIFDNTATSELGSSLFLFFLLPMDRVHAHDCALSWGSTRLREDQLAGSRVGGTAGRRQGPRAPMLTIAKRPTASNVNWRNSGGALLREQRPLGG